MSENHLEEVQGAATSSFFPTPLFLDTAFVCGAQCLIPVRFGHWQSQTSSFCSLMTGQWSDRSAMSCPKTLSPSGPLSYLRSLALRTRTSFWRREGATNMDMWNISKMQSSQPVTYRLMESVGLGGPRWHESNRQRAMAESGSSQDQLWTLMIDTPRDLMWDLPCMQQASYLEGGPLMWMFPLYLHVSQKSGDDDEWWTWINVNGFWPNLVCALILWRPGLGLLMGKLPQILTELSAQNTSIVWFPDDNMSKYQWISTRLDIWINIVEIWLGNANGQISSVFDSYTTTSL